MLDMLNMKTDSSQDDTSIYYLQALKATRPVSWWKWKWSRCWWCFVFRRRRSISWAGLVTCKVSVSWIRVNIAQLCDHQPLFLPPTHQIIDSNIWPWYRGFLLNYFSNWPTKPLVSLVFFICFHQLHAISEIIWRHMPLSQISLNWSWILAITASSAEIIKYEKWKICLLLIHAQPNGVLISDRQSFQAWLNTSWCF